jgi:hypothetical protein
MKTAEQTLKEVLIEYLEAGKDTSQNRAEAVEEAMIRFAKMHVDLALACADTIACAEFTEKALETVSNPDFILNAYPLSNIT